MLCELDSFFFVFLLILLDVIYCLVPVSALFVFFESFCLYSLNGLINGKCPSILIFLSKLKKLYFQEKLLKHFYTMLIASAKPRSARGASHQPAFMSGCLTISHTCLPCLPGKGSLLY